MRLRLPRTFWDYNFIGRRPRAKRNIYDRDYRRVSFRVSFRFLSPAWICLIHKRSQYPLIYDGAFPRSLIALSCNIIASVLGAVRARPVPHGRAHEILRRGRSKSPPAMYSPRLGLSLFWNQLVQPRRNDTRIVSDFVHTRCPKKRGAVEGLSRLVRKQMRSKVYSPKVFDFGKNSLAKVDSIHVDLAIRSFEIHFDNSIVETHPVCVHVHGRAPSRLRLTEFGRVCLPDALSNILRLRKKAGPGFRARVDRDISWISREKIYSTRARDILSRHLKTCFVLRDASCRRRWKSADVSGDRECGDVGNFTSRIMHL